MNSYPYLIAIALIEQGNKRCMPLGGKSLKKAITVNESPGELGENLVKELLIIIFQRSEEGALKRVAGDKSLLLVQIPMEIMQSELPSLKTEWIKSGDTEKLLSKICSLSDSVLKVIFNRADGIQSLQIL